MRFAIEFSADAERDFGLIFDHLFESYVAFGEGTEEALDHAARRGMDIRKAADRLASFLLRGTARNDIQTTRGILTAAEALGLAIHDHLVIGRKGHASFRSLGCSPDPRFAMHSSSINASR